MNVTTEEPALIMVNAYVTLDSLVLTAKILAVQIIVATTENASTIVVFVIMITRELIVQLKNATKIV